MLKKKVTRALEAEVKRLSTVIAVPEISDVDKTVATGVQTSLSNVLTAIKK